MIGARSRRLALPTILASALLLVMSCSAPSVGGFSWKDPSGSLLPFSQKASWPIGEEGRFGAGRKSNAYELRSSIVAQAGSAIVVNLRRDSALSSASRIMLSLSSKSDGSSPFISAAFPLLAERASLILPLASSSPIASLRIESEIPASAFSIESIALASSFRGIDEVGELRVSSGFTLSKSRDYQELVIELPFAGLADGSSGKAGLLVSYGPSPRGASMRLDPSGGSGSIGFTMRAQPGGARTVLDRGLFPADCRSIKLRAPIDIPITAFYASELAGDDYELADLGRVLLSKAPVAEYLVYRWDLMPSVLVFDFKDYETQDKYLKRLAFFVEKLGYRGTLASDEVLAPLHGWNAHDYRPEDLSDFFNAAAKKSFPLNAEETKLKGLLLRAGVLVDAGGGVGPGKGALISIARESGEGLRWTFAVHESTHAIFFADPDYRAFARALWSSLDGREKWFWKAYFGWSGYDIGSDYLMSNEFQAYLLQQPVASAEEYFTKQKVAQLLEKHPELKDKAEGYMAEFGGSFARRARQLEAWLYAKYGVEAGRTVLVTKTRA